MILTYVGNLKHESNKELIEILKTKNLNSISSHEIAVELTNRTNWEKHFGVI